MIRRKPEAVVLAHTMDRSRRELYVEGTRDRLFVLWLLGTNIDANASVREVDSVDLPEVPGGERGRLLYFANWLGARDVRIRMFADADWDRILGRAVPDRVWLTDYRDMEGYVLCLKCVDKVLRIGIATDRVTANALLLNIIQQCRRLGLIRIMSELEGLNLPFQKTRLSRHLQVVESNVLVDIPGYLRALLQNAQISLSRLKELEERLSRVHETYAATPDPDLVHGKDATALLAAALMAHGVDVENGLRLLWTSFESGASERSVTLNDVIRYLEEPS